MSKSLNIYFCPYCAVKLIDPDESYFCNKCGTGLRKECASCKCQGFWDYCVACGGEMKIIKNKPVVRAIAPVLSENETRSDQEEVSKLRLVSFLSFFFFLIDFDSLLEVC